MSDSWRLTYGSSEPIGFANCAKSDGPCGWSVTGPEVRVNANAIEHTLETGHDPKVNVTQTKNYGMISYSTPKSDG